MVYPKKAYHNDCVFLVDEHVYEPAEDTYLVADRLDVAEKDVVLEVGTGCGILAIIAAKKAGKVVAVDINPYAIDCAIKNAENNNVDNIDFRRDDLFSTVKPDEKFSLIIFNSPYLPSEPDEEKTWIGKAWAGGKNGREVIDRFITHATNFLAENGRIWLVQSSLSDVDQTIKMFSEQNLRATVIAQVKVAFETIVLVEAKH
ncbi:MAG: class I SAM-dependent methyltransferase [Candidatus Bathyarchaeota archaeon]|nr:class I SAM-dependent methyltransferase [Candidatus Bathyarchaeota archaeon]